MPDERLRWVERIAHLMNSQFQLSGTRFRFGLYPLISLLSIVGDRFATAVRPGRGRSGGLSFSQVVRICFHRLAHAIEVIVCTSRETALNQLQNLGPEPPCRRRRPATLGHSNEKMEQGTGR